MYIDTGSHPCRILHTNTTCARQEEQDIRPTDPTDPERRPPARTATSQDRDAWRENRRHHQSSQILLAFGSSSPRWESAADMGRRSVTRGGQRCRVSGGGGVRSLELDTGSQVFRSLGSDHWRAGHWRLGRSKLDHWRSDYLDVKPLKTK